MWLHFSKCQESNPPQRHGGAESPFPAVETNKRQQQVLSDTNTDFISILCGVYMLTQKKRQCYYCKYRNSQRGRVRVCSASRFSFPQHTVHKDSCFLQNTVMFILIGLEYIF